MGSLEKISELLSDDVIFMLELIEDSGYEARIVGGAVRNMLLGTEFSDVDIATTALPSDIMEIFANSGVKVIPSGIDHGTVTIVRNGKNYEITTLREDVESFGRKAKVSFNKSFETDSKRRDFTINALYMDKTGKIYDYHNGISDIALKKVRFIGDPKTRISEDYLRILRYFRFVAYYGDFNCDKEYLSTICDLKKNLSKISSERIFSELLKILNLKNAYKIIPNMIPILDELFLVRKDPLKFVADIDLSSAEKLCLLLKFSTLSADELIERHKFPKRIKRLLRLKEDFQLETKNPRKYLKQIRKEDRKFFIVWLFVDARLSKRISEQRAKNLLNELNSFCRSEYIDFNFRASDLTKYNLPEDKLKRTMAYTKRVWISSDKELSAEDCKKIAKDFIQSFK